MSGGQVVDFIFINELTTCNNIKAKSITDDDISNKSILGYIKYTLLNINQIRNNDIFFTNSRLYPRLLLCMFLIRLLRTKMRTICYHHHYNYMTHNRLRRIIHYFLELSFLRLFDDVIIPSPYVMDISRSKLNNVKLKYIEIGFNKPDHLKLNNKISLSGNLLFVGTVERRKNIHHLVELAKFLTCNGIDSIIHIVGNIPDIEYRNKIERMIQEYGVENNVKILGRVSSDRLGSLYNDNDVFVFPSGHEGYGMVLIEAMSYGLPVVAYNNSAMPYSVIHEYNGLLACNENIKDFGNMVKELLCNPQLYSKLRAGALDTATKINTYNQMLEKMKCFVDTLIC